MKSQTHGLTVKIEPVAGTLEIVTMTFPVIAPGGTETTIIFPFMFHEDTVGGWRTLA